MTHVTVEHGQFRSHSSPKRGRHRRAGRRTRKRITGGGVAGLIAAIGIMASIAWVSTTHHQRIEDVSITVPTADTELAGWIRANLDHSATFLTDGQPAPTGFASSSIHRPDQDWHAFGFLLTAPGSGPSLDKAVAAVWQSSVPVAIFPGVQVRRILATPVAEAVQSSEADRADRLLAGSALLDNPHITASPQVQASLAAGGLDLRAAATLAALAESTPVYVASIEDVKAETAAGLPARSMTVQVADAGEANTVVSGMTAAFRADQAVATPEGTLRLHWPLPFAPLPSVH